MSTPLEAIRLKCRWCFLDQHREILLCRSEKTCPIWPFRLGKRVPGVSSLKAIRAKCLDCVDEVSYTDVKDCDPTSDNCSLWPFRLGKNPNYTEESREKARQRKLASLQIKADERASFSTNEGEEVTLPRAS